MFTYARQLLVEMKLLLSGSVALHDLSIWALASVRLQRVPQTRS
jgi:hypothetical protein